MVGMSERQLWLEMYVTVMNFTIVTETMESFRFLSLMIFISARVVEGYRGRLSSG